MCATFATKATISPSQNTGFSSMCSGTTLWALIAPAFVGTSPFFVLMFYRAFRRIPSAVYDSARLDGAGVLATWGRVALPIARPTAVAVAILAFVLSGDFISPLLYLSDTSSYTLPVGLLLGRARPLQLSIADGRCSGHARAAGAGHHRRFRRCSMGSDKIALPNPKYQTLFRVEVDNPMRRLPILALLLLLLVACRDEPPAVSFMVFGDWRPSSPPTRRLSAPLR